MHDVPRPLVEHLEELRRRLFWVLGAWAVAACTLGAFVERVFIVLTGPAVRVLAEKSYTLVALAPAELFFTYLKTAILTGFVVT
ncbi:MAG: twin-arginine translocase subunit TatC, partial [Gammaproteobacteria bacterium]